MPVQQRDEGLRQCTHAERVPIVPIVSEESIKPATARNAGSYGSPIVTVDTLCTQRSLNGLCRPMQWKCPTDTAESVHRTATSTFGFPLLMNHNKLTIDMHVVDRDYNQEQRESQGKGMGMG